MSFQSVATAIPGLVAGWMLDDPSGTTLADFGSNSLPLTLDARGTLGGAAILPESARSLTSGGAAGAGTAHRAVGNGTPLQLSTGFTFGIWAVQTTQTANAALGARENNWRMATIGGQGTPVGFVWVGGTPKTLVGRTTISAGVPFFITLGYDGKDIVLIVNGVIEQRLTAPGTITNTTDNMELLSRSSGSPWQGTGQGAVVYNRLLTLGEHRKLLRAGDTGRTIEQVTTGVFFDFAADSSPVVAAASQTRWCGGCGGLMRANERAVITANDSWHASCHALSLRTPVALSSGSTLADFGTQALGLMREFINGVSRRTTTDRGYYHDGTRFIGSGVSTAGGWVPASGVASAAAIMSRYLRAPKRSPWISLIRLEMTELLSRQAASGSFGVIDDGDGFVQAEMGLMVLLTKHNIEVSTWNAWRDSFLLGCRFLVNGNPGQTSNANFYINGNRQLLQALCFYEAYLVTKDPYWLAQYNSQLTFTLNPSATAPGNGVGGLSAGFGLFDGSGSPIAQAAILGKSDTADKAYLAESQVGVTPGLDWDYLQLQLDFAVRLWLLSGDAQVLKLCNLFRNKLQERLNRTTWVLDATGGSRHNFAVGWLTTAEHILVLKNGRGDITVADLASHWTINGGIEANYRTQGLNGGNGYYRGIGLAIGSVLMAQADWPGVPA